MLQKTKSLVTLKQQALVHSLPNLSHSLLLPKATDTLKNVVFGEPDIGPRPPYPELCSPNLP